MQETEPPKAPLEHSPRAGAHGIFLNRDAELRAGWRALLFLVFFAALSFGADAVLGRFFLSIKARPALAFPLRESLALLLVLAATWIMARIEGRRFLDFGLRDAGLLRRFATGALCGFGALTLALGLLSATGHASIAGSGLPAMRLLAYALLWGYGFAAVALFEELLLRGYLLVALTRGIGFWPAAILLSVGFGALHISNKGESYLGVAAAAVIGLLFCWAFLRSGSLWWPIGMHFGWDWAESYFWGTPDSGTTLPGTLFVSHARGAPLLSGGTVGPEGSIVTLAVVVVLVPALILFTIRRTLPGSPLAPAPGSAPAARGA